MEEDIEILEEFLETAKIHTSIIPDINFEPFYKEQVQAIENLLKRYKDLKRANSDLQGEQEQLYDKLDKLEEENKELIQEKNNNSKMIALAQNAILSYEKGYDDGKNSRTSAVQIIVENQQYYIFKKQIERYEKHINKLEEENKKIKNSNDTLKSFVSSIFNDTFEKDFIPISVIQNKLDELNGRIDYLNTELNKCYIEREKLGTETDIDNNETAIFCMEQEKEYRYEQKQVLNEILKEGRK